MFTRRFFGKISYIYLNFISSIIYFYVIFVKLTIKHEISERR